MGGVMTRAVTEKHADKQNVFEFWTQFHRAAKGKIKANSMRRVTKFEKLEGKADCALPAKAPAIGNFLARLVLLKMPTS